MKYSNSLKSFMKNIYKLDTRVHVRTSDPTFGTVTLRKNAYENNGKRLYSVSSKVIHSGSYTISGLKRALEQVAIG